jgi:hypothetical protein
VTRELERRGHCPQCGGEIVFPFGAAAAQVCRFCRFLVARTDRDLALLGKVADLLPLASPLYVGQTGRIGELAFRVAGRVQFVRVGAAAAPWQEFFLEHPDGRWTWLAHAQGRWFHTQGVAPGPIPSWQAATPGTAVQIPHFPPLQVVERGQRQMVSAEGELPFALPPGFQEWYVDLAGPHSTFATIDYGDGSSPPLIFAGGAVDFAKIHIAAGSPAEAAERRDEAATAVKTTAMACPTCSAPLPLASPLSERVVCKYCAMECDVSQGALVALKQLPRPRVEPEIPLGATGQLRGVNVVCVGFMERGTTVDDERYRWREYLLYLPERREYAFLLEEDGDWQFIVPILPGDVERRERQEVGYRGAAYHFTQSVTAEVELVLGEFYWKVEIGERVQAIEYEGGASGKLSEERSADEVVWSHCSSIAEAEVHRAFGVAGRPKKPRKQLQSGWGITWALLMIGWVIVTVATVSQKSSKRVVDIALPPPTANPESNTVFTPPFDLTQDGKSLLVELSCDKNSNTWAGADVALVNETTGDVEETSLDVEYYSGVEGGESWSEGNDSDSAWFSRLPKGRYLLRVETSGDPAKPFASLRLRVEHDAWSGSYVLGSLGALVVWLIFGTFKWGVG